MNLIRGQKKLEAQRERERQRKDNRYLAGEHWYQHCLRSAWQPRDIDTRNYLIGHHARLFINPIGRRYSGRTTCREIIDQLWFHEPTNPSLTSRTPLFHPKSKHETPVRLLVPSKLTLSLLRVSKFTVKKKIQRVPHFY